MFFICPSLCPSSFALKLSCIYISANASSLDQKLHMHIYICKCSWHCCILIKVNEVHTSCFTDVVHEQAHNFFIKPTFTRTITVYSIIYCRTPVAENCSLHDILTELYSSWVSNSRQTVIVSRRNVLQSAFRAMERNSFQLNGTIVVKFSGEIGEDYGGPRREFFR